MGREAVDFEGGHLFLATRRERPLNFGTKKYKKPAKPQFLVISGKNKTKKMLTKNYQGGEQFFGKLEK